GSKYQPPPQKACTSRPAERNHSACSRTSAAGSPPVGRACSGAVQCVCNPKGPRLAASRARSSQSISSSPPAGGRISAAIAKRPGRRCCSCEKRRHTSSSRGRSTWHETTAYRPCSIEPVCGIAGLYSPAGTPNPELVDAMRAAIAHRGPDDGSTDVFGRCVLGHQRLKVIDLDTGYQPVANEAGDVVAVFNGEAYNFADLRGELRGHEVRGTGDTPVLPHLYEESGPRFVDRLHGMFALALWDASRERLVADVPLGALLSGGIDSSIVVALMAQASPEPVRTFTVGFADDRYDERAYARTVAERYGTAHEELEIVEDVAATLPRLASAYDEPLGDEAAFPTFLIAEQARRHVTVALAGDGGDEAFSGYERYIPHGR